MWKSSSLPPLEGYFGRKDGGELHLANRFLCICIVIIFVKRNSYTFSVTILPKLVNYTTLKLLLLQPTLKLY